MSDDLTCPAGQRLRQIRHPARPYQGLQHIDGSPCLHKERSGKERRDDDGYRAAVIRGQRVGRRNGGDRRHTPTPDFISDGPGEIGTQFDPYDCVGKEPPEVSPPSERIAEIRRELHEPKTQEYSSWRVWKREYDAWLQSDYFLRAKDLLAALDASEARRTEAEAERRQARLNWINRDTELCQTLTRAIGGFPYLRDCPEIGGSAADRDMLLILDETVEVLVDMLIEKLAKVEAENARLLAKIEGWRVQLESASDLMRRRGL